MYHVYLGKLPFYKDYFNSDLFTANWIIGGVCVLVVVLIAVYYRIRR